MSAAQSTQLQETSASAQSGASQQYLTFMLAGEEYGLEILRVQEIKGLDTVTAIPSIPDYVLGVINLRGLVVPIFDLRKRLELESIPFGPTTVVIFVKLFNDDNERTVGIVVDAVSEVYRLEEAGVQPPPDFGCAISTSFVQGLASVEDKMVILLDTDRLIDFGVLAEMAPA